MWQKLHQDALTKIACVNRPKDSLQQDPTHFSYPDSFAGGMHSCNLWLHLASRRLTTIRLERELVIVIIILAITNREDNLKEHMYTTTNNKMILKSYNRVSINGKHFFLFNFEVWHVSIRELKGYEEIFISWIWFHYSNLDQWWSELFQ